MKKSKTKKLTRESPALKARITRWLWVIEKQCKNGRWVPESLADPRVNYNAASFRFGNPRRKLQPYYRLDFSKAGVRRAV